uniref:Replication termination factor 2 n=1 Tax=Oryzias sinensis TaxID=183150 RepID=A0A8C8DZT1_9TELE
MGCDGGTIPKRHELVKGPKKVEKVDKNAELLAKWKFCALSQERLRRPIVSCELGRLYNKDVVIEYLLDKSAERPNADAVAHIRGTKDIKELNLTDNPEWEGERRNAKGDRYEDIHRGMFICPVVGLEMNGKHRALQFNRYTYKKSDNNCLSLCSSPEQTHLNCRLQKKKTLQSGVRMQRLSLRSSEIHLSHHLSDCTLYFFFIIILDSLPFNPILGSRWAGLISAI